MSQEISKTIENIQNGIDKITNKEHSIIFYVQDTKGNAKASVAMVYYHAKALISLGYKAVILHEKEDYSKVGAWLGLEYDDIPHYSVEKNALKIGPADFLVVPEVFGNVVESIQKLPMEKIVFVQQYEHMLDTYSPGKSWINYGVYETITTSNTLKKLIEELIHVKNVSVIPVAIDESFKPIELPKKPIIAIHCRDTKKAAKIIKQFYLKYPLLKFISFKDMHNMTTKDFAHNLKECALAVWYDDDSSFGTFPVEALKCNVPVVGKAPNIVPEWMTDDNGIWVYDENQMIDVIFNYMNSWLEDSLPETYNTIGNDLKDKYTLSQLNESVGEIYPMYFEKRISKLQRLKDNYQAQLDKQEQPVT